MNNISKLLSSAVLLITLVSCSQAKKDDIDYVLKTNYDLETCKKEKYTKEDLVTYENLIKSGEIQGYNCVGIYHIKATKDYKKAEKYFKKGIKAGNVESYYQLGSLYSTFMRKELKEIIKPYKKAANKGHTLAMHNIGVQYYNHGKYDEAIKWYEKSSNTGDNNSLIGIGHAYRMKGDLEKAKEIYLKLAVERNDPEGYFTLGVFYGKEKKYLDLKKSEYYFKKCYEKGNLKCYASIAAIYEEEYKDYDKAIEWYKKGINADSKESISRLSFLYRDLKQYNEAIEILEDGYKKLKCEKCAFSLGIVYEKHLKDYNKALEWFTILHNMGDSDGTLKAARMYELYLKDYKNAEIWFKKALNTKKNHKRAIRGLNRLKKLGVLSE